MIPEFHDVLYLLVGGELALVTWMSSFPKNRMPIVYKSEGLQISMSIREENELVVQVNDVSFAKDVSFWRVGATISGVRPVSVMIRSEPCVSYAERMWRADMEVPACLKDYVES